MIKVYISGNRADVTEREPLTSGTVGKVINFAFTEDWRLLIKYAVFEGSGRRIALTNIGESCIIPHEVLAKHGSALRVGVYGRTADGSAATPTVYAQLGIIQRGADPNADPSTKPTLPVWAQIQAQIGDLSNLTTEDKTSLVAAINEAAKSGGGGSGGKDGTGIESITYKGEDEYGGNMYTVLLTDGTSYDITAPKGAAGITPHIGDNGNWYLGMTDTGKPSRGETGLQGPAGPVGPQGPQGEKGEDAATDLTLGLTGATVGQIAKITAVDDTGKPTAWEAVDMPSEGVGASYRSWSKVWTLAVAEDIAGFEASNIDLDGKSEIMIVFISDSTASRAMVNGRLIINGVDTGKVLFNSLALKKDSHSFVIIGRADDGIEYTTMQATAEYQTYPWQGEVKIAHRMVRGIGSIIQWTAGSTIEITQASATLGQGVTIEIYVR